MLHGILFRFILGIFLVQKYHLIIVCFPRVWDFFHICNIIHLPDYNFLKDLCKYTFVEME